MFAPLPLYFLSEAIRGNKGTGNKGTGVLFPGRFRRGDREGPTVDPGAHDAWFRAKVQEAMDDPRPAVSHEDVEAHFAARRAAALRKAEGQA